MGFLNAGTSRGGVSWVFCPVFWALGLILLQGLCEGEWDLFSGFRGMSCIPKTTLKTVWGNYPELTRLVNQITVAPHALTYDNCILSLCYRYEPQEMAESPEGGMDEYGNTSPGFDVLRAALGRITASLPTEPRGAANVTPTRVILPHTSEEKFRSRGESAFSISRSPVITATKSRMAIRGEETPNPPSTAPVDFGHSGGENGERRTFQGGEDQGLVPGNFLPDPAFNELLHRMKLAGDNFGDNERGGNNGANTNEAGIFHYLSSPQTQVFPAELPERFRAGRESSSVVRNVTVRDSKRTKTRTRDDDYKRRVSISSSTVLYPVHQSPADSAVPYNYTRREQDSSSGLIPRNFSSPNAGYGGGGNYNEFLGGMFPSAMPSGGGNRYGASNVTGRDNSPEKGVPSILRGAPSPGIGPFDIILIYEGT
jgi:hypothetical protein